MTVVLSKGYHWPAVKAEAKARIDKLAEIERGKWVTQVLGQEYVYAQKLREAEAYQAAEDPTAADYPFLMGEATVRDTTLKVIAATIIANNNLTNRRLATIENTRIQAKLAVDDAPNKHSAINAIVDELAFPLIDYASE